MNLAKPIKLVSGADDFVEQAVWIQKVCEPCFYAWDKVALATTFEPCSCANNRTKCKKVWFVCL